MIKIAIFVIKYKTIKEVMMKRIALINDVTGYSRCSVAIQLPLISALGVECVDMLNEIRLFNAISDSNVRVAIAISIGY